jgi:hypothetical protein
LVEGDLLDRRVQSLIRPDDVTTMSSLAYGPEAARKRERPGRRRAIAAALTDHGSDVMLGVVVAVFAIALLIDAPRDYDVDSWLALVDGRFVWAHGIPHRDTFNAMTYGHRWTDEQWLSQLASYAVYRLGGLGLLSVANVALFTIPIGGAIAVARKLGAPFRSVLIAIPICIALVSPSREIRTQEFAIPLFVATMALLCFDGRHESRRVFWCLPILALWANLHGSASLGAGLVVLYAVTRLWERRAELRHDRSAWLRPLGLAIGAVVAILITPYGLSMIGYYHSTMVDSTLRQYVSEWQPVTSKTVSWVGLCLLSGGCLWAFGRRPATTTTWEKLALLVLTLGSIEVVRNVLFLGLFGLIVFPVALSWPSYAVVPATGVGPAQASARLRLRINGACAALVALGVVILTAITITRPASATVDIQQSPQMAAVVARTVTADPHLRVLADDRYSDFLLWREPSLAGHIAADVRFELLTSAQLGRLEGVLVASSPNFKQGARGYRLLVLNRQADSTSIQAFLAEPGRQVLFRSRDEIVILRAAAAARR